MVEKVKNSVSGWLSELWKIVGWVGGYSAG